jgi:hypothetical protein
MTRHPGVDRWSPTVSLNNGVYKRTRNPQSSWLCALVPSGVAVIRRSGPWPCTVAGTHAAFSG